MTGAGSGEQPPVRGAQWMRTALDEARRSLALGDGEPFGACIVRGGGLVSVGRNTIFAHGLDCHAEVNAIRLALQRTEAPSLAGCALYSTTEPCSMCRRAIRRSGITQVFYGTRITDLGRLRALRPAAALPQGQHGEGLLPAIVRSLGRRLAGVGITRRSIENLIPGRTRTHVVGGVLREECLELLREWEGVASARPVSTNEAPGG